MADKGIYNLLIDIRANIATLSRDMDGATSILKASTGKMNNIMRGFFEGLGRELSVGLAKNIGNISSAIGNMAAEGDKLGAISENFQKLGGSAQAIKAAQNAVLGTVNAFDLMQAANAGLLRGIPDLNSKFADLAKFANQFADATGQETVPVLNELIAAIGSGKAEALKRFGFELQEGATKSQNMAAAMEQLAQRTGELAPLTESVTQGHEAFAAAMQEAVGQVSIAINDNPQLTQTYNDLAEAIRQIDWKSVGDSISSMISIIAGAMPTLQTVVDQVNNFALGLRAITGNLGPMEAQLKKVAELEADVSRIASNKDNGFGDWFTGADKQYTEKLAELKKQREILVKMKSQDDFEGFIDKLPGVQMGGGVAAKNTGAAETAAKSSNSRVVKDKQDKELKAQQELAAKQSQLDNEAVANDLQARVRSEQALAQQREDSVQSWANVFQDVFSGSILNLSPEFSRIAGLFAKDISEGIAGLFGGSGGGDSPFANFLGSALSTSDAHNAGIQGPGLPDGSFGPAAAAGGVPQIAIAMQAIQTVVQLAQDLKSAKKIDAQKNDFSGTGGVLGQLILGNQLGAPVGSFIGGLFGRGPQNKETQARHQFAGYMEDNIKQKGAFTVFDGKGGQSKLTNFLEGSSTRFNDPKWADELNGQADKVKGTFSGLGEAFKNLLGITEDVGGQIAAMLGENLKFNLDSARHMVKRLGLSFEEIEKQLVEIGLKGDKTWLEIETQIQGVAEAFKPGLTAVGAFGQAMSNLLGSGAKGFEAVQSIRDIAVEAGEAGIKSFDALRVELLKTFDPATVDAFFKALKQRGVTSIGELMQLSDREAGGIVADMQALGVKFTDSGKKITDGISANTASTDSNTSALNANTRALGGKAPAAEEPEEPETAFAKGGVINGPTRALMGENGPEAVLPLTRRNGKLGVHMFGGISGGGGGGYIINVDARGAAPGVEKAIRSALVSSERRVMDSVSRTARRGARRTT
jgi:hypothetical protein